MVGSQSIQLVSARVLERHRLKKKGGGRLEDILCSSLVSIHIHTPTCTHMNMNRQNKFRTGKAHQWESTWRVKCLRFNSLHGQNCTERTQFRKATIHLFWTAQHLPVVVPFPWRSAAPYSVRDLARVLLPEPHSPLLPLSIPVRGLP